MIYVDKLRESTETGCNRIQTNFIEEERGTRSMETCQKVKCAGSKERDVKESKIK
ncbi:hypothetical protein [Bacillus phage SDFMU_Pbc]|uniref:Uncharacterized protein n=1 Tax=Bacillus phage SDFMU_Pbc TaxID=3076135 RepID=A0AA96KR36_9CAUD|nr:hypothetical protein [Bacillus phage SDFMU_Pbc]